MPPLIEKQTSSKLSVEESNALQEFIQKLPKAELHLHIEGTLEPELMFEIAKRNNIQLKYDNVENLRQAYEFQNLQEFLDIYYDGANVLLHECDFYDLTIAYLRRAHSEGVLHAEIFFDPQTHTSRGVKFDVVIMGIHRAIKEARREFNMSVSIIMCFLRHLDEEDAIQTLEEALSYKDIILGVGLDSSELGHPPNKFERVFAKAKTNGFLLVSHAGEEGPSEYINDTLDLLKVQRIDHGIKCLDDFDLMKRLAKESIPLTLCPLSNLKLRVVENMENYPLRKILNANILATINSDDPAYFGGYINDNYIAITEGLGLDKWDLRLLAKNGFRASFASEAEKELWIAKVDAYCDTYDAKEPLVVSI